jgi:hypothetical protein
MKISLEHWWSDTDRGNGSTGKKTCSSASLSNTDITWDQTRAYLEIYLIYSDTDRESKHKEMSLCCGLLFRNYFLIIMC